MTMSNVQRSAVVLRLLVVSGLSGCFDPSLCAQSTAGPVSRDRKPARAEPKKLVPKAEEVRFETDDKLPITLVASYTAPAAKTGSRRAPMAILLHMYDEDRSSFDPLVPALHATGFAVLAVDLRGHGESVEPASLKLADRADDRDARLFRDMGKDVEAAYRWMARRSDVDPGRFVLVGASVGGSVALEYAARDKSVDGVVILTPGMDYMGLDSRAAARKYGSRPILMLAAKEELGDADDLARTLSAAKIQIVGPRVAGEHSMALHGTRMLGKAAGVERVIADFLVEAAGPASEEPMVASMIGEVFYEPGTSQADRLSPDNLRTFSSAAEAQARGYRPSKRAGKR